MANSWIVIYFKEGVKCTSKPFPGDMPRESGVIDYAKKLKARGILEVNIVSRRKAFGPPLKKLKPPRPGLLWCPYCLQWREFTEYAVIREGLKGPTNWRCPICTITIFDYYVRFYNEAMVARLRPQIEVKKVPSTKVIKKAIHKR